MAIQHKGGNDGQQQGQQQQQQAPQQAQQQQQQQQQTNPGDQTPGQKYRQSLSMALMRPVPMRSFGSAMNALVANIGAYLKSDENRLRTTIDLDWFRVVPMDQQVIGTAAPVMAVVLTDQSLSSTYVHLCVINGSSSIYNTRRESHHGQEYEVPLTAADAIDQTLYSRAMSYVANYLRAAPETLRSAGISVIPEDAEITEDTTPAIFAYITDALVSVAGITDSFSLGMLDKGTETLVELRSSNGTVDSFGNPVRGDVEIRTMAKIHDQGQNVMFNLSSTYASLTLQYIPPTGFSGMGQVIDTTRFNAHLDITRVTSEYTNSVEFAILGILAANMLDTNMAWTGMLNPSNRLNNGQRRRGEPDMQDVGALPKINGLEPDDTLDANWLASPASYAELIGEFIRPALSVGMQFAEYGDLHWSHQTILAALEGNHEAQTAFVNAADRLFNGKFSPIWNNIPDSERTFGGVVPNMLFAGYYLDKDKNKRSLTEVQDYLYMLNKDNARLQLFMDFHDTMANTSLPMGLRLARRKQLLENILGVSNVHITGTVKLGIFSPVLRSVLGQAMNATGRSLIRGNNSASMQAITTTSPLYSRFADNNVVTSGFGDRTAGDVVQLGQSFIPGQYF